MQEIVDRLQRIEDGLHVLGARMQRIETTLDGWRSTLQTATKKEQNALRRKQYKDAKTREEEGRLPLPPRDVLKFRDKRIQPRVLGWASVGMRFGRADQPEKFYAWLIHQWNNCTYLKKPITFSGSAFRIWKVNYRYASGPRDLMHLVERKHVLQKLQNDGEYDDFTKRPWWNWSHAVFSPVFAQMQEMGFDSLPERFRRLCSLMMGGPGCWEVYTDMNWDFRESRANINKMLTRVGIDLQLMLKSCYKGLRVRGSSSPVQLPSS